MDILHNMRYRIDPKIYLAVGGELTLDMGPDLNDLPESSEGGARLLPKWAGSVRRSA